MKNYIVVFFGMFSSFVALNSQNKEEIDRINAISYDEKQKNASTLNDTFLINAQNAIKIRYEIGEADSYSNLSFVYYYRGKYEKDVMYSLKAISIYEKLDAKEKLAHEYGELGYRMKRRNLPKAQTYMLKGIEIAEQNRYQKPLLSLYNNYGVIKEMQLELDSALYFYHKGLRIKEQLNDSLGIPYSLNNIAGVYVMQKQFRSAQKLYDRAITIRKKFDDQIGIIENLTYYGDMYFAQNKYENAIDFYNQSNELARKYKYPKIIESNYQKLSDCYENIGNYHLALVHYQKHTLYKDSLSNNETNSKIAELEVKYETNKKEKLLLEKETENKKKNATILILALFAFFLTLTGYLIYRQQRLKNRQQHKEFELKNAINEIETQNKLYAQRLSISRDLHDNIGTQLTFITSTVDNLKYLCNDSDNNVLVGITQIGDFTKATIVELRDTIWAMNNNDFTFEELRLHLLKFIEKVKSAKDDIVVNFNIDERLEPVHFSSIVGMNMYRTIQEAANNALKYSDGSEISINILDRNDKISISIRDNGKGFDVKTVDYGNGLHNMRKRIEDIDGEFTILSDLNNGTTISFILPKNLLK
ncbi:MAG: tetratricopeptide repeat protein [Paludibacteraceae bacterium]